MKKIILFTILILCSQIGLTQLSDSDIKNSQLSNLSSWEKDILDKLDELISFKIQDSDWSGECPCNIYGNIKHLYSKEVSIHYKNYYGNDIVYKAILGIFKNTSSGEYFDYPVKEITVKKGTWVYKTDDGDLEKKEIYNNLGLLTESIEYFNNEISTINRYKGLEIKEEPYETLEHYGGILHQKTTKDKITYYNEDGTKSQEETKDLLKVYFEDGSLNYSLPQINWERNGQVEEYYENKKAIKEKSTYVNGKLHGERRLYYKNGNLKELTTYKNGLKQGLYESYLEDNLLKEKGNYRNDQESGEWIKARETATELDFLYSFNEKGIDVIKLLEIGEFYQVKGTVNKKNKEFIRNPRIQYITGEKLIESNGSKLKLYYKNGQLFSQGKIGEYDLVGKWKVFNKSGELIKEVNFK